MEFHEGKLYESTLVGRSPENRSEAVDLAEPEPAPRLIHTVSGHSFANDPFLPQPLEGVPADGSELLALDSDGEDLWAVGRRRRIGTVGPGGRRGRDGRRWRRAWSAGPSKSCL